MAECSAAGKLSLSLRVHNDGYLHVKNRKDKEYKKQWTVLNGDVLNFYSDKHDKAPGHVGRRNGEYHLHKYGEKIYLKSPLTLTTKYLTKIGSSTAKMTLKTGTTEVKLRADTMDCMELWRVFMLAVTELKVPEKSRLPLEHLHRVHKAIATEKRARLADPESQLSFSGPGPETPSHSLPPLPVPKPQCFYKVDRVEAEKMLQEHPELGNLLIRPATNNEDYSVSVCHWQPLNRPHRPQHYKVTHKNDRYIIELTKKVEVNSLQGVVDHFVKATNGMLTPYV
uniref:Signal transducing adaptor family member 1 n=1 Tax=Petromyzon marinus TaxID=7757 RepID=S4RSL2_PETMA